MTHKSVLAMACTLAIAGLSFSAFATPVNLALAGTASQSSTNYDPRFVEVASAAIDGVTDGNLLINPVTHTNSEYGAWWQVDLGNTYSIDNIVLWNRTDCCSNRLSNFRVSVLDALGAELTGQDFFTNGGNPNPSLSIAFPDHQPGRIVKVQLLGTNYLSLAEVQVFGDAIAIPLPSTRYLVGLGLVLIAILVRRENRWRHGTSAMTCCKS